MIEMDKPVMIKCEQCKKEYEQSRFQNQRVVNGKILIVCDECYEK